MTQSDWSTGISLEDCQSRVGPNHFRPHSGALCSYSIATPGAPISLPVLRQILGMCLGIPALHLQANDITQEAIPISKLLPALLHTLSTFSRLDDAAVESLPASTGALKLWLPIDDPASGPMAAELAPLIIQAAAGIHSDHHGIQRRWQLLLGRRWNHTHRLLAQAAARLDIPFTRLDRANGQLLQLGQGHRRRLFRETISDRTPLLSQPCTHKAILHQLLAGRGIPLPRQREVSNWDEALHAATAIGWPVVLKPVQGNKGKGVWIDLGNRNELEVAWQHNQTQAAGPQLVQQQLDGHDHRLLLSNGELMAVAQRVPASLLADGMHTLKQLIHALNADPKRGVAYERAMNRVPIDQRLLKLLAAQGWSLDATPPAGTRVQLSRTANISQGGSAIDRSSTIHPDNRTLACDICRLLNINVAGLDVITPDISRSWREGRLALVEVNISPGLRPHLVADPDTDLCDRLVRQWMGSSAESRIPVALVTGSIGKTTTTRLLTHLLSICNRRVASVSSTGVLLNDQLLAAGDYAGGGAVQHCLQDPRVEAVVGEVARGGLLKKGLVVADADLVAVLNVLDNHIGANGIRNRNDLAAIKAIAAQAARHLLVLNADDPLVLAMAQQARAEALALVACAPGNATWQAHRAGGGLAALYDPSPSGGLRLFQGDHALLDLELRSIPAAADGAITTLASIAAFAATMGWAMGIPVNKLIEGLQSFGTQPAHQFGRYQQLVNSPFQIIGAWGDGPEAVAALSTYAIRATRQQKNRKLILLSSIDDRTDAFIRHMGAACWGFDVVVCCASRQRRTRQPEEVVQLLANGVRSLQSPAPEILLSHTEEEALPTLVSQLRPGDFCVIRSFESFWIPEALQKALARDPSFAHTR